MRHRSILFLVVVLLLASFLPPGAAHFSGAHAAASAGVRPSASGPPLVGPAAASQLLHQRITSVRLPASAGDPYLSAPAWFAYDSEVASFFIAAGRTNTDVVPYNSGAPYLEKSLDVGSNPFAVAVDNLTGDVFVTNSHSDNLSVINASTLKIVASIDVGTGPMGIAFDPSTGDLYVANNGSNNVSVVSGTELSVVGTIAVGAEPIGVAYDGATGQVFVADHRSAEVSVLSDSTNTVVATVPVGVGPYGVAIDPVADTVYVTNPGSSNLSVIAAVSDAVVATVPVVYPYGGPPITLEGLAFDASDGYVWVGAGSFFTVVVDPATESVIDFSDTDPAGVAYDPDSGAICVTDTANVSFACYLSLGGWLPARALTFSETGLPPGTEWTVAVGSPAVSEASNLSTISFGIDSQFPWESVAYTVGPSDRYAADPGSGVVNGSSLPTTIDVLYVWSPGPYSVEFEEAGLPTGTGWSVDLSGNLQSSTTPTLTFSEPSGTYPYQVGTVPGWHEAGLAYSGEVAVNGASVTEPTMTFSPYLYTVNFSETGLPPFTLWSVAFASTVEQAGSPTLSFETPNGTYAYAVGAENGFVTPAGGSVTVLGASLAVPVRFVPTYLVTFGETGLSPGTPWNVTLGGVTLDSTTAEIQFTEPNDTYSFEIGGAIGYTAEPPAGTIVVAGAPTSQGITFGPIPHDEYAVTFSETGLSIGIGWSVTVSNRTLGIDATQEAVSPDSITFDLPNGTYSWGVFVPAGYSSGVPSGPLVVDGAATHPAPLAFVPTGSPSSAAPAPTFPWITVGIVIAVGVAGVAVGLLIRRHPPPPPTTP